MTGARPDTKGKLHLVDRLTGRRNVGQAPQHRLAPTLAALGAAGLAVLATACDAEATEAAATPAK